MFVKYKKVWIFSDVHLCHKNIHKYEPIQRERIDKIFWLQYNDSNDIVYWQIFIIDFINYINKKKNEEWLLYFINLWDFIFHPTEEKIKILWKDNIIKILENNIFVIWNHDLKKWTEYNNLSFNETWDIIKDKVIKTITYEHMEKYAAGIKAFHTIIDKGSKTINIFTHYPIYSTQTEEYNIHTFFRKVDSYLINLIEKEYSDYQINNYHWHVHSVKFEIEDNRVNYINCCVDYNI